MAIARSLIFYSWQSDLPNPTNRGFVQQALENAAKTIQSDASLQVEPVVDRDTAGVPGSPDISKTIFSKIDQAQVFVCDISIINEGTASRPTPNPNVLLELGYALKTLGDKRIIMVLNDVYGGPELLPFDLRMRRVIRYHMPKEADDRATERNRLGRLLAEGLRTILSELDKPLPGEPIQPVSLAEQAEERFRSTVIRLGDKEEGVRINATILLQTFLRSGYEQFYIPVFNLAVANLRLPRIPYSVEAQDMPLPLTALSQTLIVVFREAFPLARSQNKGSPQLLDASHIQLDNANLRGADLKQMWMPQASLQEADLSKADLSEANLEEADLRANLWGVDLSGADLKGANLSGADLHFAKLRQAKLSEAKLSGAKLFGANLAESMLDAADLDAADLRGANLDRANLWGANLSGANIEDALFMLRTYLGRVKGLTKEQLEICKAKGAIIDEDSTVSASQSSVSPPLSPQSNKAPASSAAPAQESISTPDTGDSSAPSSKPSLEL